MSASHSWTDQHRQLGCQIITLHTFLRETQINLHLHTWNTFSLFSLRLPFLFSALSNLSLLINLLIRNYANDPKTERKRVRQWRCWCVCTVTSLSPKKPHRDKLFKGCQRSSSRLSSSSTPSWEKRQRGGREEDKSQDQRVAALEVAWEKDGFRQTPADLNNERKILGEAVQIFAIFKYH